jgi:chromosome segregation ATPase
LREKYNGIKAENIYLLSIIEKNKDKNGMLNQKSDFSKTLDMVEEEIEQMVSEMVNKEEQVKILQTDLQFLKDKNQRAELELKSKEKQLKELKDSNMKLNQDQELNKSQLRDYVLKNAHSTQRILELESSLMNREFILTKEIESLKTTIQENIKRIENKDNIIQKLNNDILQYMNLINERDIRINELRKELHEKEVYIENVKKELFTNLSQKDSLEKLIDSYKDLTLAQDKELKENQEKINDFMMKGKTLVNEYDSKLDFYKIKLKEKEELTKKHRMEVRNLNILINEYKIQANNSEKKFYLCNDENKTLLQEKENLKEIIERLTEENRKLREDNTKINEENEMLSENK